MALLVLLAAAAVVVATPSIGGDHFPSERRRPLEERRCIYSKAYGMQGADCFNLNLLQVPTYLKSNIEILEASFNRIRELRRNSFSRYTYLKLLYLADNLITHIEDGVFESVTRLEVVDLSLNAIHVVPLDLLSLPSLRKLYLDHNRILDLSAFEKAPKSSSLEYLSMVGCDLKELPSLSSLPYLTHLNTSLNHLQTISVSQLAPACSLHWIGLEDNKQLFNPANCSCLLFTHWLSENGITATAINCTDVQGCTNVTIPPETLEIRAECLNNVAFKEELQQVQKNWFWIAAALALSVVVLAVVLYQLQRRTSRNKHLQQKNNHIKMTFDRSAHSSVQLIEDSPK